MPEYMYVTLADGTVVRSKTTLDPVFGFPTTPPLTEWEVVSPPRVHVAGESASIPACGIVGPLDEVVNEDRAEDVTCVACAALVIEVTLTAVS